MDYSFPGSNLKFNPFDTKTDLTTFKYADAIAAPESMTEGQFMGRLFPFLSKRLEQDAYNNSTEGMAKLLELGRQDAREKAKQQLMWGTLAKLPETTAAAFGGGPNASERIRQGLGAIPGIYANTLAAYPQIQVPGTSIQQQRYFTV
jgi:hypothetical protein